jgi:hypothetical protein
MISVCVLTGIEERIATLIKKQVMGRNSLGPFQLFDVEMSFHAGIGSYCDGCRIWTRNIIYAQRG